MAGMDHVLLPFLAKFGIWGIGALALLDSSSLPVPMDAFLAISVWNDKGRFWVYCLMAAAGSAIGGLLPYGLGRAGGELFLLKRVNRERFERMRTRFERQEFLAMMIPSMLPPPTPWKMFVFGAGVFEMKTLNFMAAVLAGRIIRFSVLAFVTVRYGPEMVHVIGDVARRHLAILIGAVGMILVVLLVAGVRAMMSKRPVPDQGV